MSESYLCQIVMEPAPMGHAARMESTTMDIIMGIMVRIAVPARRRPVRTKVTPVAVGRGFPTGAASAGMETEEDFLSSSVLQ